MEENQTQAKTESENPYIQRFALFFETQYKKPIEQLIEKYPQKKTLQVDFSELEHFDVELADDFLDRPDYLLEAAKLAIKEIDLPNLVSDEFSPHLRFYNLPTGKDTQPQLRDISSTHIGKLITIEGVVAQITDVLPKLKAATWECKRCGNTYKVIQGGSFQEQPTMCECHHRDFSLKAEESTFTDYQKIRIQEPIEYIKGNHQPTNIDIYVSDDLVNNVAPGDRTKFTGMIRLTPPKEKKLVYGRFLEAIHIEETQQEFTDVQISKEEEEEIRALAADPAVYEKLVKSIAPNIYGHETIKEAIMLQLFGGVKKVFPGNNKVRGNIHVILIGEPGLAKSQLLQAVDKIAPKSIYTAGKTTSAAGISATAVKDEFGEGGWTIKAGALVLASGGMALIDELDKMDPNDRSALHESMEQESISVAKAGIVTRFKSETSILAAANPKYSRFDPYRNFMEQINLPASLMSRFDLFFLLRDVLDRKKDEEIAAHILRSHRAGEMLLQKGKMKAKELQELQKSIAPEIDQDHLKKFI
ncbi:MAG: minichromosome maintenance protein MCM, partial [archaeon]